MAEAPPYTTSQAVSGFLVAGDCLLGETHRLAVFVRLPISNEQGLVYLGQILAFRIALAQHFAELDGRLGIARFERRAIERVFGIGIDLFGIVHLGLPCFYRIGVGGFGRGSQLAGIG